MSIPFPAKSRVVDSIVHNDLMLPGKTPVFVTFTLTGGAKYLAGSVLGRVTATGKLVLSASAAGDGSQTPIAVLPHDVAAYAADGVTGEDKTVAVLVEGYVNETALVFGAGHSIATVKPLLRATGVQMRAPGYSG